MLKSTRKKIIHALWNTYLATTPQMQIVVNGLAKKNIVAFSSDHFAVIDLPSANTGIPIMQALFTALGFHKKGQGYLASKQNDFTWLAETNAEQQVAQEVLPQIVVADFRLHEMPTPVRDIIEEYASYAKPINLAEIETLCAATAAGDAQAASKLETLFTAYFAGRDWPLPTLDEFNCVHHFNELLAWVLVFGRKPNHFTIPVHLLSHFNNLADFHRFITDELHLPLNHEGGLIKGGQHAGIAQGSTVGMQEVVALADGDIQVPTGFVEFVWRYPLKNLMPTLWQDYFTGFIADHADYVIESLYVHPALTSN